MPGKKEVEPVDDWEADFEEPEKRTTPTPAQQAASNARLWNEPAYTILPSTSSTVSAPPPVIAQPKMQILKRPSSAASNASERSGATPPPKSMAEREKAYQEARERIFAKDKKEQPATEVTRAPAGPPVGDEAQQSKGFARRKAK